MRSFFADSDMADSSNGAQQSWMWWILPRIAEKSRIYPSVVVDRRRLLQTRSLAHEQGLDDHTECDADADENDYKYGNRVEPYAAHALHHERQERSFLVGRAAFHHAERAQNMVR